MAIPLQDTIAVVGNSNHLCGYISYFESQIEVRNEQDKPLSDCPNYYAWLSITSEYVYYKVREVHYFNNEDESTFDELYKKILDALFSNYSVNAAAKENIMLFAKIRHLLVHKGFPNPHTTASRNNRPLISGVDFDETAVWEVCERLRSPKEYPTLKQSFDNAIGVLNDLNKLLDGKTYNLSLS